MSEVSRQNPLISVVVPVYNVGPYVERCIRSIQKQTYTNWELILVDDGSTDDSAGICDRIGYEDSRISVIHQKNGGVSSARLNGVLKSKGEFITFVDSDDALKPDSIMIMHNETISNEVDLVIADFEKNYNGQIKQLHSNRAHGLLEQDEYKENMVLIKTSLSTQARLYKRSVFEGLESTLAIDRKITNNEDFVWNLILSKNVKKAIVIDKVVYTVYPREGSASKTNLIYDYWRSFFEYLKSNLEKFSFPDNLFMLFKITRLSLLIRDGYAIDLTDPIFDDIRSFGYDKRLTIWGNITVYLCKHNNLFLQKKISIHPTLFFKKLRS